MTGDFGFLTFWYDNLFICMGTQKDQRKRASHMKEVAREANAEWKAKKGIHEGEDDFVYFKDAVDFLGIRFERHSSQTGSSSNWQWSHLPESVDTWSKLKGCVKSWILAARLLRTE